MTFRVGMRIKGLLAANKRLARAEDNMIKRQKLALRRAALLTERELKLGLRSGSPGGQELTPLSRVTRLLRRGTKPLIDDGDLIGSINSTVREETMQAFVGVHRTTRSSGGTDIVNVAAAHEFGTPPFVIPVTEKLRSFFRALSFITDGAIRPLNATTIEILHPGVPARPFIRPTIKKILPKLQNLITVTITKGGGPI